MAFARNLTVPLLAALAAGCGGAERPAAPVAATPVAGPALVASAPRAAVLRPLPATGPRRIWRGEEGVAVEMQGARVVATAGFGQMVMATRFEGPDPLDDPRALLAAPAQARRLVDLSGADRDPAGMRFGLTLDCTLRGRQEGPAILVEESCAGGGLAFTNRFHVAGGTVTQSEQWIGDQLPALVLRVVP
jgi:hypothetical protein